MEALSFLGRQDKCPVGNLWGWNERERLRKNKRWQIWSDRNFKSQLETERALTIRRFGPCRHRRV